MYEPPTLQMCNISRGSFYTVDAIKRFFRVVYRVNNRRRENRFRDTILWVSTVCFMCLDALGNRSVVCLCFSILEQHQILGLRPDGALILSDSDSYSAFDSDLDSIWVQ